ncbi:MAG: DUF167 domain-containing protein [Desulfobacterales bacterium]|jgi:hypothetical protein|nr:DUF167 domain-containing protein [Desulfobacterales bacterium]
MLVHQKPIYFTEKTEGILINIFVQPRSARNAIVGPYKDALKIKLTAPPVEGAANKLCIGLLAKCLNLPKSSIEIKFGHTGRSKGVLIRIPDGKSNQDERNRIIKFLSSFSQQTS